MHINNVRLYARHLRRDLVESPEGLDKSAHERLLLQGANGSGKSTILEAVATLWDFFGDWIDAGPGRTISRRSRLFKHYFADADLAAIELKGILPEGKPLWLGMGKVKYWVDLKDEHPDAEFAGLVQSKRSWEVQLPTGDWTNFRQRSLVGSEPKANILYFPPEDRTVPLGTGGSPRLLDLMPYHWLARYSTNIDLESLLLTVKANSQTKYDHALRFINQALDNQRKEIEGIGPQGLMVRGKTEFGVDYEHSVGLLSSGEKQLLLLIGFVAATLRPGGVVIIDEPDLHIHIVMVQQLLGSIEAIIKERGGQLIVAAHSEEVWDWFSLTSERIKLTQWQRNTP